MRLAFVDPIDWDYTVQTAFERPLGGSQSALCYLTAALARRGHKLFVFNNTTTPGRFLDVRCFDLRSATADFLEGLRLDAIVVLNAPASAAQIREGMTDVPQLILWSQQAADQPAVACLSDGSVRESHDAFVFVSQWQLAQYTQQFRVLPEKCHVFCNAIAPSFERLFSPGERILAAKSRPPVLAYTSTPFRGLELLLDVFPNIRDAIPGVTLKVFSGMQVYHVAPQEDQHEFGQFYDACRRIEGIEYLGSISQPELAGQLRDITMLTYPNNFAETSCIAVMEAMAAGCQIVTSQLGTLPETASGFARLVPTESNRETYQRNFAEACVELLTSQAVSRRAPDIAAPAPETQVVYGEDHLQRHVAFANQSLNWDHRAHEWESHLTSIE